MSAFFGNPMVTTAALPLLLGIVLAVIARPRPALPASSSVLTLAWSALLLFFYWDTLGPPAVPPVAASQKLIYLAFVGIGVGLLPARILSARTAGALAGVAVAAALFWLGWRRISGGALDLQMIAAIVAGALAIIGAAMLMSRTASVPPTVEEPFLAPAAVLATALSGAIISVLGASIVTGQLLGSLAAMTGGWCLVQYVATLRGSAAAPWSKGVEFLLLYANATVLIQVALLAPKANPAALILSPLPMIVAALAHGPLQGLLPGARSLRPLIAGILIAIPAILAILAAIVWAPHGAALGFS
ncbi:hypothetical protein FJ987_13100 [Mesorhizobium sp. CU2]|uniref:hypothetical protein n=1 Tax=unclassified Mesorhizobium TaxID=325217 RepID=UPI00112ED42D|nr:MULTISPECIES: hypothetical protein [unclassified Mesorhizobium]TPN84922.1 hypothetical protein FJ988_09855 [Mesorhizobium sp. CU3]TPO14976.1 hypothetical protein FJ987_13100 [Mesorhizobium sp. CU2]